MFGRIFNPENAFFRTADKLADLVMLSLMWALCSIPLVTLGPATAALYDAAVKILRRGEAGNIYQRFFHSFRLNFKVGALTSLAVLAAAVLLYGLGNFLYRLALTGKAGVVLYYAYLLLLLLPIGMISYLFPVLSRFTFGAGGLIGTCWKLALNHLPSTLLLGLLTAAARGRVSPSGSRCWFCRPWPRCWPLCRWSVSSDPIWSSPAAGRRRNRRRRKAAAR